MKIMTGHARLIRMLCVILLLPFTLLADATATDDPVTTEVTSVARIANSGTPRLIGTSGTDTFSAVRKDILSANSKVPILAGNGKYRKLLNVCLPHRQAVRVGGNAQFICDFNRPLWTADGVSLLSELNFINFSHKSHGRSRYWGFINNIYLPEEPDMVDLGNGNVSDPLRFSLTNNIKQEYSEGVYRVVIKNVQANDYGRYSLNISFLHPDSYPDCLSRFYLDVIAEPE